MMKETDKIKKYHLDKMVFLALFIVSLVAARLIIAVKSANLPPDPEKLLEAGGKIVAEIKNSGIASFLENKTSSRDFFVIKNSRGQILGFTMDVLTKSEPNSPYSISAAGLLYLRGQNTREEAVSFQSDNNFDHFIWKTETIGVNGRSDTELTLDGTGIMTVTNFASTENPKSYPLSPAAIPEVFYEQMLVRILRNEYNEIALDIIEGSGAVTTAFISKIKTKDVPYALNIQFLNGTGFSEQVQFDEQMRISRRILRQDSTYLLERTSRDYIIKEFPERSDYVLQNTESAGENQIEEYQI